MFSTLDVTKNLHHAYLLEGEKEFVFQELLNFLNKKLNFSTISNPDFWLGDFDSFGIDDGRVIKDVQSKMSFSSGGKKILVIKTNFITHEAQNSLLKVFEEPTEDTHLFLIMSSSESLLPTLKSRLMILKNLGVPHFGEKFRSSTPKLGAEEFLKGNITERFEMIKVFLPKKKSSINSQSGKEKADKAGVISFLNELEQVLYEDKKVLNSDIENIFSEIRQCRSYLNDRSPSVKMILEHLSQII